MDDENGDPRHVELETLIAIYPEIKQLGEKNPFTFEIELPVEPVAPITVTFPAASTSTLPGLNAIPQAAGNAQPEVDSLQVSYLPPLCLRIHLPDGYPTDVPPQVEISTTPQWLAPETIKRLEDDGPRLWDEIGRDMVAFAYIDHVQRAAEDVFGTTTPEGTLEVDSEHKLAVLDYDIKAKKTAFEKETFECGVCLDPKKGSKCHKMLDCGHIFCLQCLRDFYNDAINEGNISTVRCLTPNCAKDREAALSKARAKDQPTKKPNVSINPSELLQIGLSEDMVKRYVTLKYKTELESDKNTIYCPRQWCTGAARSKKHRKPEGLDFVEASDTESDHDEKAEVKPKDSKKKKFDRGDLLAVCEDCGFAFCSQCEQSWHGEFVRCYPKRDKGQLSEEEKASIEYLQLHTSPCPTCNAPAQKTHGCNHMICSRCDTHFCYLCSAWLDPTNPYRHYNQQPDGKVTSCYMRLWELEGGDGDDVGLGFIGGRGRNVDAPHPEVEILLEAIEDGESDAEAENNADEIPLDDQGRPIHVAREAPLVLRVMDNHPRGGRNGHRAVPPAAPDAPPAVGRRAVLPRGRGGARAGRAGGRGRGGRGGGANRQNQQNRQQQGQQPAQQNQDDLDEHQAAWVRNFVQMALNDEEDLLEGDSDDDDNWFIR
ncbi:Fc.00g052360.m01.CDS01 [Cosmosporella sp. VM-42]